MLQPLFFYGGVFVVSAVIAAGGKGRRMGASNGMVYAGHSKIEFESY